ncbi:DUF805 domain-containing protein [Henriciella sp.]|uniref:DUF805 domain-containing protein n=1 Tax=Henriciella sp. TaxID=1968823 RepID=UPI0026146E98|nr:DUF805 domain-containing protein [Henriciella sp.]
MGNLLFNPQGRIQKNRFWQGLVLLTVASVIATALPVYLGSIFGLASLLLIYPYICVYVKRFHDAGTTGWWVIAVWLGAVVLEIIEGMILGPLFMGEEGRAIQEEAAERFSRGEFDVFMQAQERLAEIMLPLSILTTVVNAVILGFIVGSLATEPRTNKHGPVPGSEHDEFS